MYEIYVRRISYEKDPKRLMDYGGGDIDWSNKNFDYKKPIDNFINKKDEWRLLFDDIAPDEEYKLTDCVLMMADNSAGSLELTIPPTNACYNYVNTKCLLLEAKVMEQRTETHYGLYNEFIEIWRGRLLTISDDFYNLRKCVFEGELAYLCDTAIASYSRLHFDDWMHQSDWELMADAMDYVFQAHNAQVEDFKEFSFDSRADLPKEDKYNKTEIIDRASVIRINNKTSLEAIQQVCLDKNKMHIRITHTKPSDFRHIRFYTETDLDNDAEWQAEQEINFGENLLDYARDKQGLNFLTAIIPRGARIQNQSDEDEEYGLERYVGLVYPLTHEDSTAEIRIKKVNRLWQEKEGDPCVVSIARPYGLKYGNVCQEMVVNLNGVEKYGLICGVVDFPDIDDSYELLYKSIDYVKKFKYRDISTVELTAVDLHLLNPDIKSFRLLQKVHCYSKPHNLDVHFRVSKMEIDMLNPQNTKYTLGGEVKGITAKNNVVDPYTPYMENPIIPEPQYVVPENPILTTAKQQAARLILDAIEGSYAGFLMTPNADAPPTVFSQNNFDEEGNFQKADKNTSVKKITMSEKSKLGKNTDRTYAYHNPNLEYEVWTKSLEAGKTYYTRTGTVNAYAYTKTRDVNRVSGKTYYIKKNMTQNNGSSSYNTLNDFKSVNSGKSPSRAYGFVIRNNETDESATCRWLWTYGGLMCQRKDKKGGKWQNPSLALTMDGEIVANRITTGTLTLAGNGSTAQLKVYSIRKTNKGKVIKDSKGNTIPELIGIWNDDGINVKSGSIQIGHKPLTYNPKDGKVTAYTSSVIISSYTQNDYDNYKNKNNKLPEWNVGDGYIIADYCTLRGKITATSGKIGFWEIKDQRHLGSFGKNGSSMSGILLGVSEVNEGTKKNKKIKETSTFGISVPNHGTSTKPNSWGGICYGEEAKNKGGWGNNSFVLFDGNEADTHGNQWGGFFVVHESPDKKKSNTSYSKQTFNSFMIYAEKKDGTFGDVAKFDEETYNKINGLYNYAKDHPNLFPGINSYW